MKKEKSDASKAGEVPSRLTRARAAVLVDSGQIPPLKGVAPECQKPPLGANSKRPISDDTCLPRKKRVVLQDVTNICCDNTYRSCLNSTKNQAKESKLTNPAQLNIFEDVPIVAPEIPQIQVDSKMESLPEMGLRSEDAVCSVNLDQKAPSGESAQPLISQKKGSQTVAAKKSTFSELLDALNDPGVVDIDADFDDPQLCSFYAADIYENLRVSELLRRPCPNFMETVQLDITPNMREILIDWLVEVCEEFNMVIDTLYLTVYLMDLFLSKNYIHRQKLQLVGVTCMLIASKFEEASGPRVKDYCVITDNSCTKQEVVNMECRVLKCSGFQLCAPTTKTFLRRFLRAAQASYKRPTIDLEHMANYLAELTLMNYSFLKFLPSTIAASAVFLAKWTLDQSSHPWNPTLEHYTSYKASDLKTTVHALRDLHVNRNYCHLMSIRNKYRQEKLRSVSVTTSPELLDTLFF